MSENKKDGSKNEQGKAEEPKIAFKTVRFFDSFEEENEYTAKMRAKLSYDERMEHIEELRKRVFNQYLLPDGSWPSISKTFQIMEPYTHESGK